MDKNFPIDFAIVGAIECSRIPLGQFQTSVATTITTVYDVGVERTNESGSVHGALVPWDCGVQSRLASFWELRIRSSILS